MHRPAVTAITMAFLTGLVVLLVGITPCQSADFDDSALFVEAFNSFQKKDYLLSIEKIELLKELFPDSPLRDVALLYLARARFKAGDNDLAASAVQQLQSEFADNQLVVEDELQNLANRRRRGEPLAANRALREAAVKTRDSRLAAVLKVEQERTAREQADKEELDRRKLARLTADKAAREAVRLEISAPAERRVEVGNEGRLSFELTNNGKEREEFLLSMPVASEYGVTLESGQIILAPGEKRQVAVKFRMPVDRMDGAKAKFRLTATSTRFRELAFSSDAAVLASAPLLRAVAKPDKVRLRPGEPVNYNITVLNAGTMAAHGLNIRVILPEQLEFSQAKDVVHRVKAGVVTADIKELNSGTVASFSVDGMVREAAKEDQELRLQLELINGQLQRKDIFSSSPAVLQAKK